MSTLWPPTYCRNCSRWVGIFAVRLLAPKTRRGGAAKSHPSLCGSWLLASRAYSIRGGLVTAMIRCRYQELDLAECHAIATAVCHCTAASAHCRQTGLRRLGTDGSQTPRRRKTDSNSQSLPKGKAVGSHSRQALPFRTRTCKWLRLSCRRRRLATPRRAFRRCRTDGSKPVPSSGKSANHRFLIGGVRSASRSILAARAPICQFG
jgi:hypothetical protein